jgi:phytoene desaturase
MNYAGLKLGTFYPDGGFGKVIDSMVHLATKKGASFHFNAPVQKIITEGNSVTGLKVKNQIHFFDAVVASADYHYVESCLLPEEFRNYDEAYWSKKTFAPSCLIFYIGVRKRIERLQHHTLFFEYDFAQHAKEIYDTPRWPVDPLFYVCCPSKTDDHVAPAGHENLFILMPVATGLEDTEEMRQKYFHMLMDRLEKHTGMELKGEIDYLKSYCINDFKEDYHAYNGNAYGLANTLMQTAILKPKITNKKLSNLFYTGQLTVPGPGVPPALISGKIVATQLNNLLKKQEHEIAF